MIIKTIRIIAFSVAALAAISISAHAVRDQRIYPMPGSETEDIIIQWFLRTGYQLRRSTMPSHGVRLFAQKGKLNWHIKLQPHSPLATMVEAAYTVNGKDESSGRRLLWTVLDDHMKMLTRPVPEANRAVPAAIVSKAESVVCIYVGYAEKSLQITGFIVDKKGLIICTAHGLKDLNRPLTVTLRDGRQLDGWVVKIDRRSDLTLLDVRTELDAPIALAGGRDLTGEAERLFNIVCATRSNGSIFSGIVSGPPRKSDGQLLWQVNMQIRPGSSGSPVFNHRGNLVAVVKGRYRGADTVGFLIPFATVLKFMGDYSK